MLMPTAAAGFRVNVCKCVLMCVCVCVVFTRAVICGSVQIEINVCESAVIIMRSQSTDTLSHHVASLAAIDMYVWYTCGVCVCVLLSTHDDDAVRLVSCRAAPCVPAAMGHAVSRSFANQCARAIEMRVRAISSVACGLGMCIANARVVRAKRGLAIPAGRTHSFIILSPAGHLCWTSQRDRVRARNDSLLAFLGRVIGVNTLTRLHFRYFGAP